MSNLRVQEIHSPNSLVGGIRIDNTDNVAIGGTANLSLNDGNLNLAAGHGINFAPQGAANVNLLDDYEEGTFNPFITSSTATNPYTDNIIDTAYDFARGVYRKIGSLVYFYAGIETANLWNWQNGGSAASHLSLGGLPFQAVDDQGQPDESNNIYNSITCGFFADWTGWSAGYQPTALIWPGTTACSFYYPLANGSGQLTTSFIASSNSRFYVSGCYFTTQ